MIYKFLSLLILLMFSACATRAALATPSSGYPPEWWGPIPESERQSWEILPQDAAAGEVIISKRTELGVFSNLAAASFEFEGTHYASVEGLWQMLKYPEPGDTQDPRWASSEWPHKRAEVAELSGFEAKGAGDKANAINKKLGIAWVTYHGKKFEYRDGASGSAQHYEIILAATRAKISQNQSLKDLLIKTSGLKLRMDHNIAPTDPPSYQTQEILTKLRTEFASH